MYMLKMVKYIGYILLSSVVMRIIFITLCCLTKNTPSHSYSSSDLYFHDLDMH